MVLIKVDRVYELTILLCGLEKREREKGERTDRECTCKPFARQKKSGEFGREKKVQKREGWEGKVVVGVTENRRCSDSGQKRGGDWSERLNQAGAA